MENEFSRLVDALPGLVWTALPDGAADFFNRRWGDYTGLSFEAVVGSGWLSAIHAEDLAHVRERWGKVLESGRADEVEARLRRHDGIYRWFLFSASAMTNDAGRVVKWCGIATDIENRKQAELALVLRDIHHGSVADVIPALITFMEPTGELESANRHVTEYLGATVEEMRNWRGASFVHPDDLPIVGAAWMRALETGQPYSLEERLRRHDGVYRWFHCHALPLKDADGRVARWYCLQTDIDDRKRAEEALVASERDLKTTINTLPTTAWATDAEGYVEFLSDRWLNYAGFTAEQGAGLGWGQVIHPDDQEALFAYWQSCLESGAPVDTEARMRRFDGEYRWFLFRANPMRDENGAIVKWYGTNIDIQDRKRGDEELRRANDLLEEAQRLTQTGSFLFDVQGDDVYWSEESFRIFEFEPTEKIRIAMVLGRFHPEDLAAVQRVLEGTPAGGTFDAEWRLLTPAGAVKHIHAVGRRVEHQADRPVFLGCIQDITGRKLAEQELQRTNSYLEEGQRLSLTGSFTSDILADQHLWSDEMFRIFDYAPSVKINSQMILQRIHPDDLADVEAVMAGAAAGADFDIEYRLLMPGGAVKHIHGVGHPIQSALDRPMIIGCLRDITERKLAEQELRRINGYLEEAQRLSLTGSFTWDVPADAHFWSDETFRIFEIEKTEIVHIADLMPRIHPDDMALAQQAIGGAAHGEDFEVELRLQMPGGSVKHVDVVGHRIREIADRPVFLGCIRDVTERKLADEALRRSQTFLVEGQRLSATGSFSWRLDTDEVLFSEELNRIFEFDQASTVTLEQIAERVHPDDLPLLSQQMGTARDGIEDHRYEIRLQMPSGAVKHVHVVGHRFPHLEDRPVFIGSVRDITENRAAEEKLRRTAEQLSGAEKLSKTGSVAFNYDQDEHSWTDEMYEIFEYDRDIRVNTQLIIDRWHPDDRSVLRDFLGSSSGKTDVEFRLLMPDGRVKYMHAVAHVVERANALPIRSATLRDITEQTLSVQALAKVRSELAHVARVTALGTLTASIAHEVNQPLSGIITNASTCLRMLAADPPNVEGARETAKRTIRDGNRAAEVIIRLRALFARKTVPVDAVDLNEATREVIALSANEVQRSHVVLETDLSEGLPMLAGDRVQLQQVVLNLLLNAIDALSDVDDRPRQLAIRTAMDNDGRVLLTAEDNGAGFEGQDPERLFDAFHTTKSGGMGIGLSVSRSIAEAHGGRLWATSNDGPGATFSLSIPLGLRDATDINDPGGARAEPMPDQVLGNA